MTGSIGRGGQGFGQSEFRERPVTTSILVAGPPSFVLAHGINKGLLGVGAFLALDKDASLPSWVTVVLFAFASAGCALLAWLRPQWRGPFLILAIFSLVLSLESTVQIHGQVESDGGNPFRSLVEIVGGAGFVISLVLAARVVPRPFQWLFLAAIVTIVAAAGASEMNDKFDLPYAGVIFFQTLEEVSEIATAILVLAGVAEPLLAAIERRLGVPGPQDLSAPRPRREPEGATPPPAR